VQSRAQLRARIEFRIGNTTRLKPLLGKLAEAFFDSVQSPVGVHALCGDKDFRSLPDIGCHDIHDADPGALLAIHENCDLALESHCTTDQFANRAGVQSALVRNIEFASLGFFDGFLHGAINSVLNQKSEAPAAGNNIEPQRASDLSFNGHRVAEFV
jgi:hypothetical protein